MPENKTTQTHQDRVLDFVEVTGVIIEKSAAMLAQKEAQEKQCSKLIPLAVEALLANGRIEPHEKDAAAQCLADPAKVLEVLIKTASHRNEAERAKLGEPTQTKKASYKSTDDGYVGRRSRPEESESSKALKRGLGL